MKRMKSISLINSCLIGVTLGLSCSTILLIVLTLFVDGANITIQTAKLTIPALQGLCIFAGSLVAGKLVGDRGMIAAAITAGCYLLILVMVSLLFLEGLNGNVIIGLVSIVAGMAASVVALKQKPGGKTRKRRVNFR